MKLFHQLLVGKSGEIVGHQAVHVLLQRADRFHQRTFKVIADTHHLSGRLHLGGQRSLGTDKFIKWQTWDFYHAVVQHRLKACVRLSGDGIFDLIQSITKGNLRRHLGNRIPCRFGRQGGRTAHTRINFDYTVFKSVRMQGILYVTSPCDIQLTDNIQSGSTQHLVFFVTQCLGRSHNDTVSGMYADRVNIFHITYRDTVTVSVPHHLIFNFFPSGNAALHKHLAHP